MSLATLNAQANEAMGRVVASSGISLRFRGYRNLVQQLTSASARNNYHTSLSNITGLFISIYGEFMAAEGAAQGDRGVGYTTA